MGYQALPPGADFTQTKWWEVLGVDVRATDDAVKAAYRKLARKYHPDGGSPDSKKMTVINAAYEEAKKAGHKCGDYDW
ncbi:DnaJ domain-containing protein [Nostoc sp. KVJ3]|uniref:J domain-containing protein n=1 Tax=Nostoc sp. KVJ3 TaxID=457945 RepID=UPI0022388260|nr:DnaJ domain-containing protein [Nostoc sp. KVJ3]MCW5317208.1 DnaJ domain-containing protein [Nostoc sp. KVJ3]